MKHLLHTERYSIEGAKKKLTELRKAAKLKETTLSVVGTEIGSVVNKTDTAVSMIQSNQIKSLQEKINSLQNLIRTPESHGLEIPGLKS